MILCCKATYFFFCFLFGPLLRATAKLNKNTYIPSIVP